MEKENIIPKNEKGDYLHALVKSGLGMIPIVGSPISEFFALTISPPVNKRMEVWLTNLYNDIDELKKHNKLFLEENLTQNENFISAITRTTQMAVKTHHKEKLKALRYATLNSVKYQHEGSTITSTYFLNVLDTITPIHLKILKNFIKYPSHIGDFSNVELYYDGERFYLEESLKVYILKDLEQKNLINRNLERTDGYILEITSFGREFYKYVTEDNYCSSTDTIVS